MPITRIQITNMARFDAFDSGPLPAVCLIEGGNGEGKTGLLDCVRYLGEHAHDPSIIHGAAEFGETVLSMDDGMQLRVRVDRGSTARFYKPKDGKRWMKGREEIDRIYKAIAYDPVKFLDKPEKEQAQLLAELSPAAATEQEILDAVGEAGPEAGTAKLDSGMTGMQVIDAIRKAVYDARTPLNTGAETQDKHADELEKALPPAAPDGADWASRLSVLKAQKATIEESDAAGIAVIGRQFNDAKDGIDREVNLRIADLQRQIADQERQRAEHKEYARKVANDAVAQIREASAPKLATLANDIGAAETNAQQQQRAEGTRKAAEVARQEAAAKRARAKVLTECLARLDGLKKVLASRLPIKDARVEDGKIVREQDGGLVPLRRWNTSDQVVLCLKIGMMIGGGFVVLDGIEKFDAAHRKALFAAAKKYAGNGTQFIMAKVDDAGGPFRVTSV